MLKYPILVLDHDDTVVMSEATVNFPYFQYILGQFRPGATVTQAEYTYGCCHLGFNEMCRSRWGFTEAELEAEYRGWQAYVVDHAPEPFPGIRSLLDAYRTVGGRVCVVSHSCFDNISRDYRKHFGFVPEDIFGWDYPEHQRKPNPYPLECILKKYGCSPASLLMVDDMLPGCHMAKQCAVPSAFAAWGRTDYPELSAQMRRVCDFSFDTPEALLRFLLAE